MNTNPVSASRHPDPAVAPIDQPVALLGGLSAADFMRSHWQRQPLLVRQALPGVQPPISRAELFRLADAHIKAKSLATEAVGETV